jgi:hypothetical protein
MQPDLARATEQDHHAVDALVTGNPQSKKQRFSRRRDSMPIRRLVEALILVAALAALAPQVAPAATAFRITSTLDGKTVLPHRIHWIGAPGLPDSRIKQVDFLIDGRVAWREQQAPYTYADDGGYLVTSWLTPGRHRFTVRAIAKDGRSASDTVVARVLPPPDVPGALAGTWRRTVTDTSGAPSPNSAGNPTGTLTPPGTYSLTFDRRWIQDVFPCTSSPCKYDGKTGAGGMFDTDWTPGQGRFEAGGGITFRIFKDTDRLAGWWCETYGPAATYTWSVNGDTLTLAPVGGSDTCGVRGFIWSGQWTRA